MKNVFLHGDLEDEIYMKITPGYWRSLNTQVCRLRKALYGLKQSPRTWFGRLSLAMKKCAYSQSNGDHSLFFRHTKIKKITILILYVNDIIINRSDLEGRTKLEQELMEEFAIKNFNLLKYFLRIEVAKPSKGIILSQQKYILYRLTKTCFIDCQHAKTPIEVKHGLTWTEYEPESNIGSYQRLFGKVIYLLHTHPDVSYVVNYLGQFMHNPRVSHLQAAHQVLRYLKGTVGWGLHFKRQGTFSLDAYTDFDFIGSLIDCRSTTGYYTFLGGNLGTWRSKKTRGCCPFHY